MIVRYTHSYAGHIHQEDWPAYIRLAAAYTLRAQRSFGFEALLVRGTSGCLLGAALSGLTGIPIGLARKNDGAHTSLAFEGAICERYAFVDDFIAGGATLKAAERAMQEATRGSVKGGGKVVCALLGHNENGCRAIASAWPEIERRGLPVRLLKPYKGCMPDIVNGIDWHFVASCPRCDWCDWRDDE